MTVVHVLTPVTRPENLGHVSASITAAAERVPEIVIDWHLDLDLQRSHVGGNKLRNQMLDRITTGWCYQLDDDTLMHPDLLKQVRTWHGWQAVIVSQSRPDGWHSGCADPARLKSGVLRERLEPDDCVFDTGMALFRRELVGDWRFPPTRTADGDFWEQVLEPAADRIRFVDEELAYYNALRPGEWG